MFEGNAAEFSGQRKYYSDAPVVAAADVPDAGATSPSEAFGMSAPAVETTAAVAFTMPEMPEIGQVVNVPEGTTVIKAAPLRLTPQTAAIAGVEVDSQGLPYDARIHSSSRERIKDGTWKLKRGTDPALVESVRAEYKAVMAIPAPTPILAAPWPFEVPGSAKPPSPPNVTISEPAGEWTANGVWPLKVDSVAGGLAPMPQVVNKVPPVAVPALTFPALMQQVGAAITGGRMAESDVHTICARHGVPIHTLGSRPDLLPIIGAEILAKANG